MKKTLDLKLWDFKVSPSGLCIDDCELIEVAEKFSTPLFVLNEAKLRHNCSELRSAFYACGEEPSIYYSYKTNSTPGILRIIHEEGIGSEVISDFELDLTQRLGVRPDQIVFDAIYKTEALLERLVLMQVKCINIDSISEIVTLEKLARKHGRSINVGVRVHEKTGWGDNPFGVLRANVIEVFKEISNSPHLVPCGLHLHSSSWFTTPHNYIAKAKKLIDIVKEIKAKLDLEIKYIDLGGGYGCSTARNLGKFESLCNAIFGIQLCPPVVERFVPLSEVIIMLHREVRSLCTRYNLRVPQILIEPGTAIVADTQFLLTKISAIKNIGKKRILVTDSGRINMAQPLKSQYHEAILVNRPLDCRTHNYKVVGRLCSPGDWLYQKKLLPEVQPGDLLAIMDTGAYFTAFANNFAFPRPPVVSLRNGQARLMRRGEDFAALTCLDDFS